MNEAKKVQENARLAVENEKFGIAKDFDVLENFLFGCNEKGAIEAFKRLSHIRAVCDRRGLKVF